MLVTSEKSLCHGCAYHRDRLQRGLKEVSTFLSESNLFGSKLLPAIVLLCVAIAALDVFQVIRLTAENILPPSIITFPDELYAQLAPRELLLKIFAKDQSIHRDYDIYRRIVTRGEEFERDPKSTAPTNYWAVESGKWWKYAGDFKLLTFVALISCVVGLACGHWRSPLRLVLVLVPLSLGFLFCTAKHLYAREQQAFVVLNTLELELHDLPVESPAEVLRKRAAAMGDEKFHLGRSTIGAQRWWELRWLNVDFFRRGGAELLFGLSGARYEHEPHSIWTSKELRDAELDERHFDKRDADEQTEDHKSQFPKPDSNR